MNIHFINSEEKKATALTVPKRFLGKVAGRPMTFWGAVNVNGDAVLVGVKDSLDFILTEGGNKVSHRESPVLQEFAVCEYSS